MQSLPGTATSFEPPRGSGPVPILLVEDDDAHAELMTRVFERDADLSVYRVSDGAQALEFLRPTKAVRDSESWPRPHLVLLDLRLPRIGGLEVLRAIKSSDSLAAIPVVILTTSTRRRDIDTAYEEQANSYLVKPLDYRHFSELMALIYRYWLDSNESAYGEDEAQSPHHD